MSMLTAPVAIAAAPVVLDFIPRIIPATAIIISRDDRGSGTVKMSYDMNIKVLEGDIMIGRASDGTVCFSVVRDNELEPVDEVYIKDGKQYIRVGDNHYDPTKMERI